MPLALPQWLETVTTFHNVPVTVHGSYDGFTADTSSSALDALLSIAKPEDIVIFKLDIDMPLLERGLVDRIITEPALYSRIDEFFYEDHYISNASEMGQYWNEGHTSIYQSFSLFQSLRRLGIMAHVWP